MISSCYAGIFRETGLLDGVKKKTEKISAYITPYGAALIVSTVIAMITCNQTLSIMLTNQICRETEPDTGKFAIYLENTAVVIAALVPWSVAAAVPLAAMGAQTESVLFAVYLYALPLWNLAVSLCKKAADRKNIIKERSRR